jgi:selenocysteine-specific elongation factor
VQGATKKVKSLQQFRKPVQSAQQGERVAICVPGLDPTDLERGIATDGKVPVPTFNGCVAVLDKIPYFKGEIMSKAKFHVTVGHTTVMATAIFFQRPAEDSLSSAAENTSSLGVGALVEANAARWPATYNFDWESDYVETVSDELSAKVLVFALLEFEKPVTCPEHSLLIGAKLDFDVNSPQCRIAFCGRILTSVDPKNSDSMKRVKVIKQKQKEGRLDRVEKGDKRSVIIRDLFAKEADTSKFAGLKVSMDGEDEPGVIEGSFGKGSKMRVRFPNDVKAEVDAKGNVSGSVPVFLKFKKYVFDPSVKFSQ